ncbi:MAG: hypothetical protein LBB15_02525, partial [Puniceicoccales bacterium]|nr:hypothetical protein [Puniceicoccales bacterium]
MFSILNLLALELENRSRDEQSYIVLSDRSMEFLRGIVLSPIANATGRNPSKLEEHPRNMYPANTVALPR